MQQYNNQNHEYQLIIIKIIKFALYIFNYITIIIRLVDF